jgi:hypothetical protein
VRSSSENERTKRHLADDDDGHRRYHFQGVLSSRQVTEQGRPLPKGEVVLHRGEMGGEMGGEMQIDPNKLYELMGDEMPFDERGVGGRSRF